MTAASAEERAPTHDARATVNLPIHRDRGAVGSPCGRGGEDRRSAEPQGRRGGRRRGPGWPLCRPRQAARGDRGDAEASHGVVDVVPVIGAEAMEPAEAREAADPHRVAHRHGWHSAHGRPLSEVGDARATAAGGRPRTRTVPATGSSRPTRSLKSVLLRRRMKRSDRERRSVGDARRGSTSLARWRDRLESRWPRCRPGRAGSRRSNPPLDTFCSTRPRAHADHPAVGVVRHANARLPLGPTALSLVR